MSDTRGTLVTECGAFAQHLPVTGMANNTQLTNDMPASPSRPASPGAGRKGRVKGAVLEAGEGVITWPDSGGVWDQHVSDKERPWRGLSRREEGGDAGPGAARRKAHGVPGDRGPCFAGAETNGPGGRVGTSAEASRPRGGRSTAGGRSRPLLFLWSFPFFRHEAGTPASTCPSLPENSASCATAPFWPAPLRSVQVLRTELSSRWKPDGRLAHGVLEIMPSKTHLLFSAVSHTPGDTSGRHAAVFLNRSGGFALSHLHSYAPITNGTRS